MWGEKTWLLNLFLMQVTVDWHRKRHVTFLMQLKQFESNPVRIESRTLFLDTVYDEIQEHSPSAIVVKMLTFSSLCNYVDPFIA
jgi:hypothetical protein